jgi:putative Mg2+ transporter-C (MgtC) family protein
MDTEIIVKLSLTAVLGFIIGLERELKRKPVGLKTSLVISIVSCLLTIVSIEASEFYAVPYAKPMDPLRLAAQIVSGIGFLGAGVILRRNNDVISGLTTAAMIWGAAGLGIAVGAGFLLEAILGVVAIMISVEVLPFILKVLGPQTLREKEIKIKLRIDNDDMTAILKEIKSKQIGIKKVKVKDIDQTRFHQLEILGTVAMKRYTTDVYDAIRQIKGVISAEVETF